MQMWLLQNGFFLLAVFKGVFEVTYLIKNHPSGNLDTIALFMIGI